jgi:ferritin
MKPNKLESAAVSLILPRLNDENNAYYFYRSAYNWCNGAGFKYAAEYFKNESADELVHARGLEDYLSNWNVIPNLSAIEKPVVKFEGLIDIIEQAYEMEYALYEAYEETAQKMFTTDLCTFKLMQDYLQIQVVSIAEYSDFLNQIELIDKNVKLDVLILEKRLFEA